MNTAAKIAEALKLAEGAYSKDRYRSWPNVAAVLIRKGHSPREAAAIMLSKWARWAADSHDGDDHLIPAKALLNFMADPRNNCDAQAVRELVDMTYLD